MPRQRFTTEEIIHKLREADVLSGQGRTVVDICKQLGITDKTYFRWRKSYGGLRIDQAKRMKDLEAENARLKKAVAELTIDKIILKEVAEGKFGAQRDGDRRCIWCDRCIGIQNVGSVGRWAFQGQLALCPRAEIR